MPCTVLAAMGISSAGGKILERAIQTYPGIASYQPVINGVAGNLVHNRILKQTWYAIFLNIHIHTGRRSGQQTFDELPPKRRTGRGLGRRPQQHPPLQNCQVPTSFGHSWSPLAQRSHWILSKYLHFFHIY